MRFDVRWVAVLALSVGAFGAATAQAQFPGAELGSLSATFDSADATPAARLPSAAEESGTPANPASYLAADSVEKRLAAIEKELKKQADAAKKSKADAAKKPTQKWSGRIHTDYWGFPTDDPEVGLLERANPALDPLDKFAFRRVRFTVAGDILETMLYKIEMEFAVPENPAFKDCYIGWKELPVVETLLLGNQKRPYGLDHLNSSRYNVFMERPFIVEALNQDARRFGLESYGVSEDEAWNWRYGAFMSQDMQFTGQVLEIDTGEYQPEVAARLANTIWYDECSDGRGYAHWAVSGATVFPASGSSATTARFRTRPEARTVERWLDTGAITNAHTYEVLGLEGVVNVGAFSVVAEYMNAWVQRDFAAPDLHFHGAYVYAGYFLTGEHIPWERESGTIGRVKPFENFFLVDRCCGGCGCGLGAWQVAVRLSYADFSDENVLGGEGEAITFALNWHWNPYARMQFNYIVGEIDNRTVNVSSGGVPVSLGMPAGTKAEYDIIGARFMVDF